MNTGFNHFTAVFKARTMEFVRDRGTLIWNLVFPLVLVFGFAFAIPSGENSSFKIGTVGDVNLEELSQFKKLEGVEFIAYPEAEEAAEKLRRHQLDLVLDVPQKKLFVNHEAPQSRFARDVFFMSLNKPGSEESSATWLESEANGAAIRYVDWLVPGVIAMNMMFSSLFGVGFVLVRYRKNGVLKRLKATPVSALTFISAQALSRLLIVTITAALVYSLSNVLLGFRMEGSYLLLLFVFVLGALSLISLGLIFATRFKSEELVNGILNLLTFPMILLSGVFFSLEGSPAFLQQAAKVLPLTQVIDSSRAIMLEGAGLIQILPALLYMAIFTFVCLLISAFLFKWE